MSTTSSCETHHRAAREAPHDIRFEYDEPRLIWRKIPRIADETTTETTTTTSSSAIEHLSENEIAGNLPDDEVVLVLADPTASSGYVIFALEQDEAAPASLDNLKHLHAANLPQEYLDKFLLRELPAHLTIPGYHKDEVTEPNVHVLVSIKSGIEQAEPFYEEILQPVLSVVGLKEGKDYIASKTQSTQSVKEYARNILLPRANEGIAQTLVLLSGDGGIVDVINGLFGSNEKTSSYVRPTIALLPLGTANALFHSLRRSPEKPITTSPTVGALRNLLFGSPHPLPIFRSTFSPGAKLLLDAGESRVDIERNTLYGAVVASYGLHSTLVADSDTTEWRKHGAARFGMVAKELLFPGEGLDPHKFKANLSLYKDGKAEPVLTPRSEHSYILSTLVSNLERTFTMSPASRPFDRQLRIVHFGAMKGEDIMAIMKRVYEDGAHVDPAAVPAVSYEAIDGMRLDFLEEGEDYRWRRVCIDGSTVAIEEGGWVDVRTLPSGEEPVDILTVS